MDEEWEILPRDGFLDYYGDGEKRSHLGGGKKGISLPNPNPNPNPKIVINTNYFVCPSSPPKNFKVSRNQLVRVPIQLESAATGNDPVAEIPKEVTKVPIEVTLVPPVIIPKIEVPDSGPKLEADQDSVSQVFFKKMKENEFVDMKLDSPTKSYNTNTKGFVPPQVDAGSFAFEEKIGQAFKVENLEGKVGSPRMNKNDKEIAKEEDVAWRAENSGGLNLWKWSLTGVGAICSFGVAAAATICIVILGSHQKSNKQQAQNQNLGLQIYADDKRITRVVHHATKLNETISAVRGVPITRAHITFGGYYDGL